MYTLKTLSNGVRVIVEKLPEIRSVTLGFWVKAGSVCEDSRTNGMSHFIEHLLFKGTAKRTYRQIAEELDKIGGQLNAFTGKECTCYYAKVIDEKQAVATDVLSDMICNSIFEEKEIDKERGVVIEEIAMNEDDPEDVAHDRLCIRYFAGTELSKTILGPADNIRAFTRDDILAYQDRFYTAQNLLVVAVGNVDVAALIGDLEEKLCTLPQTSAPQPRILPYIWEPAASFASIKKDTEQVHICLGLPGYSYCDRKKYAMMAVSNILGGSMSSRLFQRVREELGMAYSIYSYPSVFSEAGMLCIYAGTSPANAQKVTQEIIRQMERFKITEEELANTKEQLKGNFILAQESMSTKMNALGKNIMLTGGYNTESDVLHYIDCVCMRDIDAAVSHMFDTSRMTGIYVGARDVSSMRPLFIKED